MRIRERYARGVGETGGLRGREKTGEAPEASRAAGAAADSVQISTRGHEIRRARLAALAAPEIREQLVDEIVAQLGRGEYDVRGEDVAPKLIREHLLIRAY